MYVYIKYLLIILTRKMINERITRIRSHTSTYVPALMSNDHRSIMDSPRKLVMTDERMKFTTIGNITNACVV